MAQYSFMQISKKGTFRQSHVYLCLGSSQFLFDMHRICDRAGLTNMHADSSRHPRNPRTSDQPHQLCAGSSGSRHHSGAAAKYTAELCTAPGSCWLRASHRNDRHMCRSEQLTESHIILAALSHCCAYMTEHVCMSQRGPACLASCNTL